MIYALLTVLLLEAILQVSWNRSYWSWGLPVFSRRIPLAPRALVDFPIDQIEAAVASERWPRLLFRPLPDGRWAFRESYEVHWGIRYPPLMRGLIIVDRRLGEVRLVGWCNWTVVFVAGTMAAALAVTPSGVGIVSVVLLTIYFMQRHRYLQVDAAIRGLLATDGVRT